MSPVLRHSATAFVIACALGIAVVTAIFRIENGRLQAALDRELGVVTGDISRYLIQGTTLLYATHAFLVTRSADISRARFSDYVANLQLTGAKAGLHGLGFAQALNDKNRGDAAMRLQRDYGYGGALWPSGPLAPRSAIVLLEPSTEINRRALGFDMLSETTREAIMLAAKENPGVIYLTPPLRLVQETEGATGLLYFLYLDRPTSGDEQNGMPDGWVYAPIRAPELFQTSFSDTLSPIELLVRDKAAPSPDIYRSSGYIDDHSGLHSTLSLAVAGREWEFFAQERITGNLFERYPFTFISATLMVVIVATSTLAVQALSQAMERAHRLTEAQSQLMREKDLYLREMSHRIKNSLTRVSAMARQAARGSESKEEFVNSMNARLQAMAKAQDVMMRNGDADLRQLIEAELAQILGDEIEIRNSIDGPMVMLNPRETQALGLSFHELATNSLKYGAGAIAGSTLSIQWTLGPSSKKDHLLLKLLWDEHTGQPARAPSSKGFGTQLLDSCIRLELGGKIERDYHENGLTIHIEALIETF